MNKKILALCLCFVVACAIFVGCKKKAAEPVSILVTDENGVAVTDENGEFVTKMAVPVTDKDGVAVTEKATNAKGEVITDADGNPKYVVATEAESDTSAASTGKNSADTGKVPYSTTAPENNKKLEEWNFGKMANVGINAPNGWSNDTVNMVSKNGTDMRVVANPVNYLKDMGYKTADDYVKFLEQADEMSGIKPKVLSYSKEVYEDGMGIAVLKKVDKDDVDSSGNKLGRYHMIYFFQTGDRVRSFFVYGTSEKEVKASIADVIANTYYRG